MRRHVAPPQPPAQAIVACRLMREKHGMNRPSMSLRFPDVSFRGAESRANRPAWRETRLAHRAALLALTGALLISAACSSTPEPTGPTPEELARQEAEAAKAAEPPPPPPPAEPGMSPAEAEAILSPAPAPSVTEESVPEFRYLDEVDKAPPPATEEKLAMVPGARAEAADRGTVRVAVLHEKGQERAAIGVATVIDRYQNERLSKAVGKPIKVAYTSRSNGAARPANLVRYRVGMLKAALQLATVLPGDQLVEPMTAEEGAQAAVDVVIYLGSNMK